MFENNAEKRRFEWTENGLTAFADYRERPGYLSLPHVEAPVQMRGTGAAGRLMAALVDYARENSIKLRPICPYAVAWFKRHPDDADVLA